MTMTASGKLWCFLLLIPALLAVGFDVYVNSGGTGGSPKLESLDPATYQASDLGYVLVTYAPSFYESLKMSFEPATWDSMVDPLLQMNTYLVALAPLAVFLIWLPLAGVFKLWPFEPEGLIKKGMGREYTERRMEGVRLKFKRK